MRTIERNSVSELEQKLLTRVGRDNGIKKDVVVAVHNCSFPLLFSISFLSTLLFINKEQETFLPAFSKIFFVRPPLKTIVSTFHSTVFSFNLKVKK